VTAWLAAIKRQSRIVVENIVFKTLNERIQLTEQVNAAADEALISHCWTFADLMQNPVCRELFYSTVPDKKLVALLKLIEQYAATSKPAAALELCQEVLTLMHQLFKQGSRIVSKPLLAQKLTQFFEIRDRGCTPDRELFADVYSFAIDELRLHTFESVKASRTYEQAAHRLPADSLVAKYAC
jgi:hypothetical protein